jgi:hypothetical protein
MAIKPPKGELLAEKYPNLANEWHPTKNGELSPYDVTNGSNKKVWWKCAKGNDHEWEGNKIDDITKQAYFYIRKIITNNNKVAIKFGVTNQMNGSREQKQKRHLQGILKTIYKVETKGVIALEIENRCKYIYGSKGYLLKDEMPDGFTETVKYSEESLHKIKSIVDEVLTEKAEEKNV